MRKYKDTDVHVKTLKLLLSNRRQYWWDSSTALVLPFRRIVEEVTKDEPFEAI